MLGKNTYLAVRKIPSGSITASNTLDGILDGAAPFSVDAMVRVIELVTDKSVLKIDGIIDFGLHEEGVYAKLPGYPAIYTNNSAGTLRKNDWIHIAVTSDGSRVSVYIDGVLNCSTFCTSTRANSNADIVIGDGFTGDIRYVRVFSDFLDADTVKEIMHETSITQVPLAWFDFTQNPAKEIISNSNINLTDVAVKSFTTAVNLVGNSYIEVPIDDLLTVRPGYYDVQNYSVQMHFKFDPGDDGHAQRYDLLSDMGEYSLNGISLWLESMDDGYHLCFLHAFIDVEDNQVISVATIKRGAWTNVAVTFNVDTIALYVNGKLDTKKDGVLPSVEYDDGRKFIIGASYDDALNDHIHFFAGYISQCDVWTKTLSEAEVYEYIDADPEPETEKLGFSLTIDRDGCFNGVTYNAVSLGNHARVMEDDCNTVSGDRETVSSRQTEKEPLTKDELIGIYELCCGKWNNYHNENGLKCGTEMPYMVKALHKGDMVYFVGCDKGRAYTIGSIEAELTTEEITWWVELILMIIGGICSAIFGLRLRTGSRQLNKLINLFYSNVKLSSSLKVLLHTDMSALAILQFCKLLYNENVLIDMIKLVITQVSFWSVITICAKFVSWATGYGWAAAAVQLGALVVEVGLHIASYPNEDKKQQPGIITLTNVHFSDDGIITPERKGILKSKETGTILNDSLDSVHFFSKSVQLNGNNLQDLSIWNTNTFVKGENKAVAVYTVHTREITVCADFTMINPSDNALRVEIWGQGEGFFPESVHQEVELLPRSSNNFFLYFTYLLRTEVADLLCMNERITWWSKWEDSGMESTFQTTDVQVFTIPRDPIGYWLHRPIWYDALYYLYCGALNIRDTNSEDGIRARVTEIVNKSEKLMYTYVSVYARPVGFGTELNLTRFLLDMQTVDGMDALYQVNCSDCAAVVTSLCNMIGIQMHCERMANSRIPELNFQLKPILSIGHSGVSENISFSYHEVAISHTSARNSQDNTSHKVYDASLSIDPIYQPNGKLDATLPCGISFSQYRDEQVCANDGNVDVVDDSYREHLCVIGPTGVGSCYYWVVNEEMATPSVR